MVFLFPVGRLLWLCWLVFRRVDFMDGPEMFLRVVGRKDVGALAGPATVAIVCGERIGKGVVARASAHVLAVDAELRLPRPGSGGNRRRERRTLLVRPANSGPSWAWRIVDSWSSIRRAAWPEAPGPPARQTPAGLVGDEPTEERTHISVANTGADQEERSRYPAGVDGEPRFASLVVNSHAALAAWEAVLQRGKVVSTAWLPLPPEGPPLLPSRLRGRHRRVHTQMSAYVQGSRRAPSPGWAPCDGSQAGRGWRPGQRSGALFSQPCETGTGAVTREDGRKAAVVEEKRQEVGRRGRGNQSTLHLCHFAGEKLGSRGECASSQH